VVNTIIQIHDKEITISDNSSIVLLIRLKEIAMVSRSQCRIQMYNCESNILERDRINRIITVIRVE